MPSPKQIRGPLPEFTITDRDNAERILKHPGLMHELKWVVSIGSLERPPDGFDRVSDKRKLRLRFDDMDRPYYQHYHLPSEQDARRIVRFARKAAEGPVLVHCAAGQSRSAATAYLMLAVRMGEGREEETARRLHALAAEADQKGLRMRGVDIHPNRLLVCIGDRVLGREGRLWNALVATMGPNYQQGFDPRMTGY